MFRPLYLASLSIAVLLVLSVQQAGAQPSVQPTVSLELGKPIERPIAAGETQSYTLTLSSDQYAHVVVDQRAVDLVVVVYGPDGAKIVQVDSPNYNYGVEPVFIVAGTAGEYRLELQSQSPKVPGRYEVKLEELRAAAEPDRNRIAAQQLFEEAVQDTALRDRRS